MKKQNRLLGFIDPIIPIYSHIPLILVLLVNTVTYYGTRLLSDYLTHFSPELPIDSSIPFIPEFISIYILSYAQWVIGYIIVARESREVCYRVMGGAICAKLICLVIFLVYPTYMERPEVVGDGLWDWLVRFIYASDNSDHLFPSIHCLESWICFRSSLKITKLGSWYRIFSFVFAILVFASTVFVKQHCFIDIFGGVAVAELGILIWEVIRRILNKKKGRDSIEST